MRTLDNCPGCSSFRIQFRCSGPTTRKLDNEKRKIFVCRDCSHEFMNPQPTWDELGAYYSAAYSPYDPNHGASQGDREVLAEAKRVGNFRHIALKPGLRLLDVGCGGGYFLRIMNQLGFQTMGVEPSESRAEVAHRDGLNIFHGTLGREQWEIWLNNANRNASKAAFF
jgi:hypothetical protein